MSIEFSSIKIPNLKYINPSMFGGEQSSNNKIKSPYNMDFPTIKTLTTPLFIFIYILLIIAVLAIFYNYFYPIKEGMSGGTLTQLFSQDGQNSYLNSAGPGVQSGNFKLFWNQPSMVANPNGTQRGTPLPNIRLPNTSMNPNLNELNTFSNNESSKECTVNCGENSKLPTKLDFLPEATCSNDPGSCGGGAGGKRLEGGFIEPTDDSMPFVGLNGVVNYPSGYLGSLWTTPGNPDYMKPLKVIQPLNTQTYVREGYE